MTLAATVAQDLTAAAFVGLGAAIAYMWYRYRLQGQGRLAVALVSLATVAAVGRIESALPNLWPLAIVAVVALMLSSYFVLLFRDAFIPLSPALHRAAAVLLAITIAAGIVDVTLFRHGPATIVSIFGLALVAVWAVFTGEPILRFWIASNSVPAVQRARLRFFSFGFAVLILILFTGVIGGRALQSPTAIVITQLIALVTVPAIYVSFAPPALLRRIWRMSEENAVRAAMQDLLIFSPTREVMAERAIFWAVRLVGATAGFVADAKGTIMATAGISDGEAATLLSGPQTQSAGGHGTVITAPLHLTDGTGVLAVVAGSFTPVFGSEEIAQLTAYANSVSAGLERTRVTERMTALEENKSQFLNLASHELRGPITVLRGYVSMLENGMLGALNDRGRAAAGVMAAKVSEMNELIEEMIDAARLEEGGLSLRPVDSDLREIVREAVDIVAPLVDSAHRLELDLPDRRVRVKVDPERTRTIISNLLSNAIKYSPDGGTVTCRVSSRAGIARVAVSDEGIGIARDHIATLFTRFGRILTPETEHLKGTGLGLFLARQLARLQEGEITVTSEVGSGSTFTLQLPVAAASEHGPGAPEISSADGEPARGHRVRASGG